MFRSKAFRLVQLFLSRRSEIKQTLSPITMNFIVNNNVSMNLHFLRFYAKGKNKLKEDKGKGKKKVEINETLLGDILNIEKMKSEFAHSINKMKETFAQQISLRSTTGSIENLRVNFEGHKYTLIELGQVNRKNPKTIIINMSVYPQAIPAVLKAIAESGMTLNPQQDATTVSIPIPRVTKEHRESLAKNAKVHFIKCRDGIRDVQNKYLKIVKRQENEGLSEDASRSTCEQIKYIADIYISEAEKILEAKQTELLGSSDTK